MTQKYYYEVREGPGGGCLGHFSACFKLKKHLSKRRKQDKARMGWVPREYGAAFQHGSGIKALFGRFLTTYFVSFTSMVNF